jgi:hypothetical protein
MTTPAIDGPAATQMPVTDKGGGQESPPTSNGNGIAAIAETTPEQASVVPSPTPATEAAEYFAEALDDAERLMKYVAESGIDIDDDVRKSVLHARATSMSEYREDTAANLLTALTKLAARVRPVTAQSLMTCSRNTHPTVRSYWIIAIVLAVVIVPFSIASFVSSAISKAIEKDIASANELSVKLRAQLEAPSATGQTTDLPPGINTADILTELQQFAATIRAIDTRARQLNLFVLYIEKDPFAPIRHDQDEIREKFQLPAGPLNFRQAAADRIAVYQDVRYFAQSLVDDTSVFYGAVTTCILPCLYALLGTCAYLLRCFEQQVSARTFVPSVANSARFLIAAIGGAVVGLFNNFSITQAASIPPLAIAFLVGYAVDVFFSFLEGLIQTFTKSKDTAASPSAVPTAGP